MTENISKCEIAGSKVPSEELRKYTNYIDNLAASKVTSPKNVASDAGTLSYCCYQFSEISMSYKLIIIRTEGDFFRENLNLYSKKVVDWLRSINTRNPLK